MQQLEGKVAVVTGGASGIGLAMAERLAAEGARLVLADIEPVALERAVRSMRDGGAEVVGVTADVARIESVEALLHETLQAFGGVHILCNNAGVQVTAPVWQISMAQWRWLLGVNLWGVIHGVHTFVPHMLLAGEPCHIVNTASMAGLVSLPMMGAYQVSKHGVVTLSETLREELRRMGAPIGVSVLCPAFVRTALHTSARNQPRECADAPADIAPDLKESLETSVRSQVMRGMPAREVADAVIDAIRAERLHVFTHREVVPLFMQRVRRILNAAGPA